MAKKFCRELLPVLEGQGQLLKKSTANTYVQNSCNKRADREQLRLLMMIDILQMMTKKFVMKYLKTEKSSAHRDKILG